MTLGHLFNKAVLMISVCCLCRGVLVTTPALAQPVASFTANQASGCSPLNVQFTNTSTGAVSYSWDFGDGNNSTLVNPSNIYSTPGTYNVTLIATSSLGQNDTLVSAGFITVNTNPVAGFTAQPLAACPGTPIAFTNNSVNSVSWLWDFGDGNTSVQQNPTHTYLYSGTYTVQLIAYSAAGCSNIQISNQYITVYPSPVPVITSNMTTSCNLNQVFSFNASGTGISSWFWNFGDGNTSVQQNPNHIYGAYGIFLVTLTTTSTYGCVRTTTYPSYITIDSLSQPVVTASITGGCAPLNVTFNATVSGNITSYAWNFGDNGTASFASGNHLYNYPGSYTVQLTVTNTAGCTATVVYPNLINISTLPAASFTIVDTMGCKPFTAQFINTSTNATSYYWNFGDGGNSTQANPTYTYINGGTYNVQLIATTAAGCSRSATVNAAIDVTSPIAGFSGYPRAGCAPLTVTFTNISYGNNLTYFWDFGDGNTSTQPNPVHTYNNFGNYDVTLVVTDDIGCADTITRINYVMVNSPTASFSPQPTTQGCAPFTTQFSDNTAGAISWFWDFGDGDTSSQQSPTHIFTTPGFYTVQLTIGFNGGCVQTVSNFSTFNILGAEAGFTLTSSVCPPYDAFFTDTSHNAVSWFWTFGDGNTSTQQHPTHTYSAPGYYNVTLTITDNNGCSHTTMLANAVYFAPFGASYTAVPLDTVYPMPVNFFANSVGATGWFWDFGDGGTSTQENPTHTYLASGLYTVTLTVTNGTCTQTYVSPPLSFGTDTLSGPPVISPTPPQPRAGCAPFTVAFNDAPAGMVSWLWHFGDGDSSTLQFPVHTYLMPGVYTVTLNAIDAFGNPHYLYLPNYVIASGPVANFGIQLNTNCNNTVVNFVDSSFNAVQWFWDFGDNTTDTIQHPSHLYPSGFSNNIVTLTVTDSLGCSNSLARQVVSNFVSAIITLQPEVCLNDTVNFNTSFLYYNSYLWNFGDGNTSAQVAPSHIYTTPGSYTVTLTVTDNVGCSQTFTSAVPMDVFNPVAAFTTVGTRNGCDTLTVEFVNNSTGADHYYWDFGDNTISTAINPVHTYNTPGQYTVTLVAFKGICSSVSTMPNYVNVTNVIASFTVSQPSQCLPFTVNFTDLSSNAISWQWDFGDSTFSTLQNPSHLYTSGPDSNITLTVTNAAGCTADTSVSIPYFSMGMSTGTFSGCNPINVLFYDLSNNAVSWLWDFGDGGTSTQQYPNHNYDSTGTYTVTLIATSASGCTDTLVSPNFVTVNIIDADFTSPVTTGCAPTLVNFTDLTLGANSWLWDFGDNSTSTLQNPSHIYNQPGVYTVTLIAGNNFGCDDTIVKVNYITILGPVTNFSVSATSGCNPLSISFTDLSANAVSWSWGFGDGNNSNTQNPQHTYTDTGSFTVTLITWDSSGCSSYYTLPQPIVIHPVPQASFTASSLTGCSPHTVLFTNTSSGHDSVTWDFGDGNTSTLNNPSNTYLTGGNYYVTLAAITQFGCTDTSVSAQPIVVHQTPDPAFTTATTGGCPPFATTFVNQSTNLVGATFFWDFGNGNTSTQANPSATFSNPGFYTVTLIVTNSNGCSDTLVQPNYIHVYDTIPPSISPILSVSVTSNTSVDITWQNNTATDLMAYVLYRLNPQTGNYNIIYTDTNVSNTQFSLTSTYADYGLNTLSNTYTYKLLTIDRCGYAIPLDSLTAHTTINVSAVTVVNDVQVSWSAYGGCPVSTYEIYRNSPYSSWQFVASVSPGTFTYLDTMLDCPYNYSYRITATSLCGNNYTSNSDTAIGTPINTYLGQTVNVVRSTVVANSTILTEWLPPVVEPAKVTQYDVYRSEDNINFAHVATVPAQQTDYMDYDVDVQSKNYFYRIDVINVCNIQAVISNVGSSILLKGDKLYDGGVHLYWTPYVGWNVPIQKYIIERLDENGNWYVVTDVNGTITSYEDH